MTRPIASPLGPLCFAEDGRVGNRRIGVRRELLRQEVLRSDTKALLAGTGRTGSTSAAHKRGRRLHRFSRSRKTAVGCKPRCAITHARFSPRLRMSRYGASQTQLRRPALAWWFCAQGPRSFLSATIHQTILA